jgi:transposase InsO family protein
MAVAADEGAVVLTNDLDFGTILAARGDVGPSVIQLRAADLRPESLGDLLLAAITQVADELRDGAAHAGACPRLGIIQSMGRVASELDNSVAESFNSALKTEFVHRRVFATREDARRAIGAWIATFYNRRRRHS